MKHNIIDHLIHNYGFEKRSVCDEDKFWLKLSTLNGNIEYHIHENAFYIWSGLGTGFYSENGVVVDEDNQCYGYRVVVKGFEHVDILMQVL